MFTLPTLHCSIFEDCEEAARDDGGGPTIRTSEVAARDEGAGVGKEEEVDRNAATAVRGRGPSCYDWPISVRTMRKTGFGGRTEPSSQPSFWTRPATSGVVSLEPCICDIHSGVTPGCCRGRRAVRERLPTLSTPHALIALSTGCRETLAVIRHLLPSGGRWFNVGCGLPPSLLRLQTFVLGAGAWVLENFGIYFGI